MGSTGVNTSLWRPARASMRISEGNSQPTGSKLEEGPGAELGERWRTRAALALNRSRVPNADVCGQRRWFGKPTQGVEGAVFT